MDTKDTEQRKRFCTVMYPLSKIYDLSLEDTQIMEFWLQALSELSIEEVEKAAMLYVKSPDFGTFKPKPADIIKMIEGTSIDKSFSAWSKVEKAIRRVGSYQTVVFDDPIIHRVIEDMDGWISICQKDEGELPFVSKEFCQRYKGFSSRRELPIHPVKLYGITDRDNSSNGFNEKMEPVLIGNVEKSKLLLSGDTQPKKISARLLK